MPAIITEADEFTTNVEIPVNTDLLDASVDGAFRKGIQALANRTKNLLGRSLRWRSVADIAALQAIAAADRADGDVVLVRSTWAVYVFRSGSSAASAAPWIYLPSAGTGRWHHVLAPHVQTSPERWLIPPENHLPLGVQYVSQASPSAVTLDTDTYKAIGSTLAVGPLLAGDKILIDGRFIFYRNTADLAAGFARLEIDGTHVPDSVFRYDIPASPVGGIWTFPVCLTTVYTVPSDVPGGVAVGMTGNRSFATSGAAQALGPFSLRAVVIRP